MTDENLTSDFTPPELDEIAALLPAYEVLSLIAKGGMGAVYHARQISLDRDVAIKILPRHFGNDAEFRASFEAEAKSMAKLNHPNLVAIYDFGQIDGMLYIIMEMVQGKSLYYSCYGQIIDPTETIRIVSAICDGLAHAHENGILHRDIKPANILLTPKAVPKISDFGLARPVNDGESETVFGTPGYTAPEVIHNPSAVDESTDIYSVGAILYQMLTGDLPEETYVPASALVECDPRFDEIILKAMHPDPAMRYRSADAMATALRAINSTSAPATTESPASSPQPVSQPVPQPTSRPSTPPTPTPTRKSPVARNLVIICILLGCIYFAWETMKDIKAKRIAENVAAKKAHAENIEKANAQNLANRKKTITQTLNASNSPQQEAGTDQQTDQDILRLREKCNTATRKIYAKHQKKFLANLSQLKRDLNYFHRNLPKSQRATVAPKLKALVAQCQDGIIPADLYKNQSNRKLLKIIKQRLATQKSIESQRDTKIDNIRAQYKKKLQSSIADYKSKKLTSKAALFQQELDQISSTKSFLKLVSPDL